MKLIRWWGLASFVALLILFSLAWYLLAPGIIASSIEKTGSEALGAQLEIGEVELSLFPVSVEINQLAATDPDQPMQNLFESEKIVFSIDSEALLWKKIVIDELQISGIKTATARERSGALPGGRKSTQAIQQLGEIKLPEVTQETINSMLEEADLITLKRIQTLKQTQQRLTQEWREDLDKKALEERINTLRSTYKKLSERAKENKLNLLKDRKEWKKLKKSIDTERQRLASLSNKLKQDKATLGTQLKQVKQGPKDDLNAIMQRLGVAGGVDGLLDRYLGPQYTPWVKKLLSIVKQVKPANSSQEQQQGAIEVGKKVYFTDNNIFPEVLIKKVILNGKDSNWQLDGKGANLAYLPWLSQQPALLNLSAKGSGEASMKLSSNWSSPNQMLTKLNSQVDNWAIKSMPLMQTQEGAWLLNSGRLSATINTQLTLDNIDFKMALNINKPALQAPENINDWQQTLAQSINNEPQINLVLEANGDINQPQITIKSNIEKLFQNAIGEKVKQKAEKLKEKVRTSLNQKIGDISGLENSGPDFNQWESQVGENDKMLQGLLKQIKL